MTKVVNIKNLFPNWVTHSEYVYIGRAGHGLKGYFGNPVVIGKVCPICSKIHKTGGSTLSCYEIYLRNRIENDESFRDAVKNLKDKILVCFCVPKKPCHGNILKRYVENLNEVELNW